MAQRIDVLGSINVDLSTTAARLPSPGETVAGGDIAVLLGGKGANQAIAAARAGGDVAMWGVVGAQSFGIDPIAEIAAAGVDTTGVFQRDGASGAALITVDAQGENCIVVSPGANALAEDVIDSGALTGDWLLAQLELAPPFILTAFEAARKRGARTVLNAAPALPAPPSLFSATDILIVNETELSTYSGNAITADASPDEIAAAARSLSAREAVIATLGARGAIAITTDTVHHAPAPTIDVVDTTGAGDCFCGALCAELAAGAALEDALNFAITAASLSATRRGAAPSMPLRADIRAASASC